MGHLDGEGTGGGCAGAPKVSSKNVALLRGRDVHVLPSVGPADDRRGCMVAISIKHRRFIVFLPLPPGLETVKVSV